MLEGLMQHDHPLTVQHIVDRMRRFYRDSEVVTLEGDHVRRASYGDVTARVDRCPRQTDPAVAARDPRF